MIRKLIFLPLILLFISCTVTKRVHRPGFYIQWRKIERTQSSEKQQPISREVNSTSSNQKINSYFQKVNQNDSAMVELDEQKETASIIPSKSIPNKRPSRLTSITEKISIKSILKTTNKKATASSHRSNRPIFWRMSTKNLKSLGAMLIFLGILIIFGSLLTFTGAFSGGGSGAWANFFISLIEISSWFWFLVVILLIVLLFYLAFFLVKYVFGGALVGSIIGLSLLVLGVFFHILGKNREIEP